jgi:hypothetical protein
MSPKKLDIIDLVIHVTKQEIFVRPCVDHKYHTLEQALLDADNRHLNFSHVSVETNLAHIFCGFYCLTVQR